MMYPAPLPLKDKFALGYDRNSVGRISHPPIVPLVALIDPVMERIPLVVSKWSELPEPQN